MDIGEIARLLNLPRLPQTLLEVEGRLRDVLDSADPAIERPARRFLDSGGKRLRPILVIASANIRGAVSNKRMVSAAAAIELIHMGSLVHDDIIDKHTSRRGVPTLISKEGLNTALLVGDWLFSRGLAQAAAISPQAASQTALTICSMCEGQALELAKDYQSDVHDLNYLSVAEKKSAALITAACQLGGQSAGLTKADIEALSRYAQAFGVAFQILDDISDGDFGPNNVHEAAAEAKKYIGRATKSLKPFETGPSPAGLAVLAEDYMRSALNANGLLKSQKA